MLLGSGEELDFCQPLLQKHHVIQLRMMLMMIAIIMLPSCKKAKKGKNRQARFHGRTEPTPSENMRYPLPRPFSRCYTATPGEVDSKHEDVFVYISLAFSCCNNVWTRAYDMISRHVMLNMFMACSFVL